MLDGMVLSIHAIRCLVQTHILSRSPHSIAWWSLESVSPHSVHRVVPAKFILWRRTLVGSRSWITAYHDAVRSSPTSGSCKFVKIRFQFLFGSCCTIRINGGSLSFFFNDTATTEIYTLSLHDPLL